MHKRTHTYTHTHTHTHTHTYVFKHFDLLCLETDLTTSGDTLTLIDTDTVSDSDTIDTYRHIHREIQRDGGTREVVIRVNAKRRMEEEDGIEGGRGVGVGRTRKGVNISNMYQYL